MVSARLVRCILAAAAVTLTVDIAARSQPSPTRRLLDALKKATEELTDNVEMFNWAVDVVVALRLEREPPEAPKTKWPWLVATIPERLEKQLAAVNAIPVPAFEAMVTAVGALPTEFDTARPLLRSRVEELEAANTETLDAAEIEAELQSMHDSVGEAIVTLDVLTRVLLDLVESGFDFKHQVAFAWFNNEAVYRPKLVRIQTGVREKRDDVSGRIRVRKDALRRQAVDIRRALAAESAALRSEATRLRQSMEALTARSAQLDAVRDRLTMLERRIDATRRLVDAGRDAVSAREQERQAVRLSCGDHQTYDACPDAAARTDFDRRRFEANEAVAAARRTYQTRRAELQALYDERRQTSEQLSRLRIQMLELHATLAANKMALRAKQDEQAVARAS